MLTILVQNHQQQLNGSSIYLYKNVWRLKFNLYICTRNSRQTRGVTVAHQVLVLFVGVRIPAGLQKTHLKIELKSNKVSEKASKLVQDTFLFNLIFCLMIIFSGNYRGLATRLDTYKNHVSKMKFRIEPRSHVDSFGRSLLYLVVTDKGSLHF